MTDDNKRVASPISALFDELAHAVLEGSRAHYGERLVSFVIYGSVARGAPRSDSDLDFLIVADPLPDGRWARVRDFSAMERERLAPIFEKARRHGLQVDLSPMIKTRAEAEYGSPVFLDMVEEGRILFDRGDFMKRRLERLRHRLNELGARRIWRNGVSHWDLKPDYKPGDVIEL